MQRPPHDDMTMRAITPAEYRRGDPVSDSCSVAATFASGVAGDCPVSIIGGRAGTPDDSGTPVFDDAAYQEWLTTRELTDVFGADDGFTSLDLSEQPCNDEAIDSECKLSYDDLPPPEWQCIPLTLPEANFWFSGCKHERKCVYEALILSGNRKALHRFINCGGGCRMLYQGRIGDESALRLVSFRCGNRYCPRCSRIRSQRIGQNVSRYISQRDCRLRFVTLTLRHNSTGLRDQLKRLTQCVNNLKRRDWWKDRVKGGMMFTEVKLSRAGKWHVHAHLIMESSWLEQKELSQQWQAVTGDSMIVDVREVKDAKAAASYVAKYGSKSFDAELLSSPQRLAEVMIALHGARLCTAFGTWRSAKLTCRNNDVPEGEWQDLGTLRQFVKTEEFLILMDTDPKLAQRIWKWFKPRVRNVSS
jgi:hypothetical protein